MAAGGIRTRRGLGGSGQVRRVWERGTWGTQSKSGGLAKERGPQPPSLEQGGGCLGILSNGVLGALNKLGGSGGPEPWGAGGSEQEGIWEQAEGAWEQGGPRTTVRGP